MSATLGVVSTDGGNLNVRRRPSPEAAVIASLKNGTALEIRAAQGGWYRIRAGNLSGWVSSPFVLVQDDGFQRRNLRSLAPDFERWAPAHRALVEQALAMLGSDAAVFDALPPAQQRKCWGWAFRDDPAHLHHKDIVCADLVRLCLEAAGVGTEWRVEAPPGTEHHTPHAANYFRPRAPLRERGPEDPWLPGDILIYWDGELSAERVRHVSLYVGPFAGMDRDGRLYPETDPPDVADAAADFLDARSVEQGTHVRGLRKDRCLIDNLGHEHALRLRHVDLDEADPGGRRAPRETRADDPFAVPRGQLTFDAEGMEARGPFFSRVPHVPSGASGVTIGRGYDLGRKRKRRILADLREAGIAEPLAERFAAAAGLRGGAARDYIARHLADAEITPEQQKALFQITYRDIEQDAIRLCTKPDVVEKYGVTDWEALHPGIRDVTVDLRYRGDFTPRTRRRIQALIVANDLPGFRETMGDESYWHHEVGVPLDRLERRREYLGA